MMAPLVRAYGPDHNRCQRRSNSRPPRRSESRPLWRGRSVCIEDQAPVISPHTNADWEKLSIFLNFLLPKLPAPREEDLSKGILEAIDMDSYRVEKQAAQRVQLSDQDAEIDPVPTDGGGHKSKPELDRLSNIIRSFNDLFGNITWADTDRIRRLIATEIPDKAAANPAYQNAKQNSDKQNARIEHDKALAGVIVGLMKDDTEPFKQFSNNPKFKRWLTDTIFSATYDRPT